MDIRTKEPIAYEALSRDPLEKGSIQILFKKYQAIGQLKELKTLCFNIQLTKAKEANIKRTFINVDFDLLSSLDVPPIPEGSEIVLEISELEALHDVDGYLLEAQRWKKAGYQFAIDDFGAGFVSLSFLSHLVPEYIKIDRSAILRADASEVFRKFLSDLIKTLRNYTKKGIVAEGVETEQELAVVRDLGISLVQGFLFGLPRKADQLTKDRELSSKS